MNKINTKIPAATSTALYIPGESPEQWRQRVRKEIRTAEVPAIARESVQARIHAIKTGEVIPK